MPPSFSLPPIVLASGSSARRDCLTRLGVSFSYDSPEIDETPYPDESPSLLVERLSREKAHALAGCYPHHLVIGSDQVCAIDGRPVGKPGGIEEARRQLRACAGQRIRFHTGIAVYDTIRDTMLSAVEPFDVQFRALTPAQIDGYLHKERPFECAGSFRMEGSGIALFSALEGRDPNALMGLPVILLCDLLASLGYDLLSA